MGARVLVVNDVVVLFTRGNVSFAVFKVSMYVM
jgi:hypothetical protein